MTDPQRPSQAQFGGVVHTYRKYDPQRFPMPDADPPDLVSAAFDHLLTYGSLKSLTPEQLANAIRLDPSQIKGFGPSIEALQAMLEERRQKILATYETDTVQHEAQQVWEQAVADANPPANLRPRFEKVVRSEQLIDFESLWYRVGQRSAFAGQLLALQQHLANRDEIDELASNQVFTGQTPLSIEDALEIKEELTTIDRLLKQLAEAAKNAQVYVIDMDDLARFADESQMEELEAIQQRINELLEQFARQQGLMNEQGEFQLTPQAYRVFQGKLLDEIFSDLEAAKSGRHQADLSGDGAVELQRTKPYEFGDSLANMDVVATLTNAMRRDGAGLPLRIRPDDIEIHYTRNTPKCATVVCMDMSGSMQWGGLYIHVKRMALALHGLIRSEYPGDFLDFVEICTLPKRRHVSEVAELLPKPVTIRDPLVRLMADMSDENMSALHLPPHFTNIQHALQLARQMLQVQDTPNRQIILITDGQPTAHFEDHNLFMLYPPDERTEHHTLREGLRCRDAGITINFFLLSSWSQNEDDVRFAHRLAEKTSGRVFFTGGNALDRFVVWDYVQHRRRIIG